LHVPRLQVIFLSLPKVGLSIWNIYPPDAAFTKGILAMLQIILTQILKRYNIKYLIECKQIWPKYVGVAGSSQT